MKRKVILGIIVLIIIVSIFIAITIYSIFHPTINGGVTGTATFPALNLLGKDVDENSISAVENNLKLYTLGKFNPSTAYILQQGFVKKSETDGTTQFQFYMVVPEVKSTYQISFTSGTIANPIVTIVCAPTNLQPDSSSCYQPPNDDVSYIRGEETYV